MKKISLYIFLVLMWCNVAKAIPKCIGEPSFEWKNCQGTLTFNSGAKYIGEFNNGMPHGQGKYIAEDGSIYIGSFKDGAKYGQGTFSYSNGEKYIGEFKDNEYHGKGTQTTIEGDKFVGNFNNGLKDGYGVIIFSDGMKYEGGFKNDMMHGQALITSPDGKKLTYFFNKGNLVESKFDVEKIEEDLSKEFRIAGILFEDSLLNYFTEDQIKEHSRFDLYKYKKDKKFYMVAFLDPAITKEYEVVQFMLKKNDKSYKIYGLTGTNFYKNNIKDCYDIENKISKKILNIYQFKEKVNINEAFTNVDEKSNMKGTGIFLKSGNVVNSVCYDWSVESGKDDNFKISFLTEELNDWITSN